MNIDGIILAAGLSKRFGRPKQLLSWQGQPLIGYVAGVALSSILKRIVVVTGHVADQVREALLPYSGSRRLKIVLNAEFEEGQSTSIRRGIAALDPDADAAMFISCDQPLITPDYLNGLIKAFVEKRPLICYPVYKSERSNPCIFSSQLFTELKQLSGDIGGRVLIERYRSRVLEHAVPTARAVADIDRQQDVERIRQEEGNGPSSAGR